MSFNDLTQAAAQYFPKSRVKYKDHSFFMKFFGNLLFFKKGFMTDYPTTLCSSIYFPNQHFVKVHPITSSVLFLHELIHLHSSKKKACLSSLYVIWKLSQRLHFTPHLEIEIKNFIQQLHRPWLPASLLNKRFQEALCKIRRGKRPYSDAIFDVLDDLINKV
jgi:hypothetical protein